MQIRRHVKHKIHQVRYDTLLLCCSSCTSIAEYVNEVNNRHKTKSSDCYN